MVSESITKIHSRLTSSNAQDIKRGMRAIKDEALANHPKIYTALVCLAHFNPQVLADTYFDKPDYLYNIDGGDTRKQQLLHLLTYITNHPEVKYDNSTVRHFILQNCKRIKQIALNSPEVIKIARYFITSETLVSLDKIVLEGIVKIPTFVFSFTHLKHLTLVNGYLKTVPEKIDTFAVLETLNLSNNDINKLPESICTLGKLQTLDLSYNDINKLPENIGSLDQLKNLDLYNNELAYLPKSIGTLPHLQQIDINFNFLITLPKGLTRSQVHLKGWANPYIKITQKEAQIFAQEYKESLNHQSDYSLAIRRCFAFFLFVFGQQHDISLGVSTKFANELKIPAHYSVFEKLVIFNFIIKRYWYDAHGLSANEWDFLKHRLFDKHVIGNKKQERFKKIQRLIPNFNFKLMNISQSTLLDISVWQASRFLLTFTEEIPVSYLDDLHFLENWGHPKLISQMVLREQHLIQFPQWLRRYPHLKHLNLGNNQLTSLPAKLFSKLTELSNLYLDNNQLEVLHKDWDVSLKQLMYLDLSNNQLTALPAKWNLPELVGLYLSNNQLEKVHPQIFNSEILEHLDLSNNQLTYLPAQGWEKLQKITEIRLCNNQLTDLPEALLQLPHLQKLSIAGNWLTHLPEDLVNQGIFEVSDFVHNCCNIPIAMKEAYLAYLDNTQENLWIEPTFTNLFCIAKFNAQKDIRNATTKKLKTYISEENWSILEDFSYQSKPNYAQWLVFLQKHRETLHKYINWHWLETWMKKVSFHQTQRVLLGNLSLAWLPDFAFRSWQNPWVDLSENELQELPKSLNYILDVSRINLSYNLLEEVNNRDALNITQVKQLNLSNNFLADITSALFAELPRMTSLNLSHNYLTELPKMHYTPKLKKLDLSHNLLSIVPTSLTRLENLQSLNLSYNHLGYKIWRDEYPLPLEISHLERLTHLNLSFNFLTWLPTGIGLIDQIKWLNLSHNKLAHMPIGIYDSMTLEVLDLSYNTLVHLPSEMAEVDTLQTLILTGNPLPYYEVVKLQELMPQTTIIFEKEVVHYRPQNEASAQINRHLNGDPALMYKAGMEYKQTFTQKALYWLRRAAHQGHLLAQTTLALHSYENHQLAKARYWYSRAAAQGDEEAAKTYEQLFGIKIMK